MARRSEILPALTPGQEVLYSDIDLPVDGQRAGLHISNWEF